MIADMLNNTKLNPLVTELFTGGRKLTISLVFITQYYFTVPKFYTLFHCGNSKQTGALINCIQSFSRF